MIFFCIYKIGFHCGDALSEGVALHERLRRHAIPPGVTPPLQPIYKVSAVLKRAQPRAFREPNKSERRPLINGGALKVSSRAWPSALV